MKQDATVNLAIQFLPLRVDGETAYAIIDKAIEKVQQSGLRYFVSPFETTVEGSYARVMDLLTQMQEVAFEAGAGELLINMKLNRNFEKDLHISDKTGKYYDTEAGKEA